MNKGQMREAFERLDQYLTAPTRIIIGGGAALMAAYDVPITTEDVDGVPDKSSVDLAKIREAVAAVGRELKISQNWLNDYFSTFLFVLPRNYGERLVSLFQGKFLRVAALGKEDLLLMKCFAGREKDLPHARVLIRKGANLQIVSDRLLELVQKKIPGADNASDFFDDLCDEMGVSP